MFKQHKMYMGLKSFMIRSVIAIDRLFIILPLAHFFLVALWRDLPPLAAAIRDLGPFCAVFNFAHLEKLEHLI